MELFGLVLYVDKAYQILYNRIKRLWMTTKTIPISQARANIFKLVDETTQNHQPIIITGKNNDAVLLSLDDWNAIQETLYLTSMPGMRESIIEGFNTPIDECETELKW